MTPEKEIKNVVTRMARVTEQQIVQRMHDFNASIEARSAANRPVVVTDTQPQPVQTRIEETQQSTQRANFMQGTGIQQTSETSAGSSTTGAVTRFQIVENGIVEEYDIAATYVGPAA